MHELSLAEAVVNAIKGLCADSGWRRVRRVALKVGRMRQVDPELLTFAFEVVTKGTLAEGAGLSVLELPTVFKCNACEQTLSGEGTAFLCQSCGSADVELLSGMELIIESMEVDQGQTL